MVFRNTNWSISGLVDGIKSHHIALPDLQRPYVWETARVRNLFDSLYRGYPTWLIILLENEVDDQVRTIWENTANTIIPRYVVIDGQQRLTSLYAALTGFKVKKDGELKNITISFNPIDEQFEVADSATAKWKDWIYDIKEVIHGDNLLSIANDYLAHYKEKYGSDPDMESKIYQRIQKVHNIKNVQFICIEIFKDVEIDIVSDIFLRINSWGKTLNNSDFILTLMSVYREEWRKKTEEFSEYTRKRNDIVQLWEDEVVRSVIWVWFKRSRLQDAYNYLKSQKSHFEKLNSVIDRVTDHHQWNNFLLLLKDLWFIHSKLITQKSTIIATYIFYILWITEYGSNFQEIWSVIKKYFLTMFLTQKYSSNAFETVLWKDFQKLQHIWSKEAYFQFFEDEIKVNLTNDTWKIIFPKNMDTSSILSPLFVAFTTAQIYFQKQILLRKVPMWKFFIDLKDKEQIGEKSDIDLHHIFPKQYLLDTYGVDQIKTTQINQIANKVYLYNSDNKSISAKSPEQYIKEFSEWWKINLDKNLDDNAIPTHFYQFDYYDFLEQRKKLMLELIKKYVDAVIQWEIHNIDKDDDITIIWWWETNQVEFKSTFRRDVREKKQNDALKNQITKTIAAFLNSNWGVLYVWVDDDGNVLWLENDILLFWDKKLDWLLLSIDNLLRDNFSKHYALITTETRWIDWNQVIRFSVKPSSVSVYVEINWKKEFYIRRSASSIALTIEEAVGYINDHFSL